MGSQYPRLSTSKIPSGFAEVEVKLNDNGEIFPTLLVAGSVGSHVTSSKDKSLSLTGLSDTARPASGWWYFILKDAEKASENQAVVKAQ